MPPIVNLPDFVKVAVIAFVFIWLVNQGLSRVGAAQYGVGKSASAA